MSTILGLTGSFGSGKSTVASMFRELGVPVVDADKLAREVVEPGGAALPQIVKTFGDEVLTSEGALDRKKMAALAFGDPDALNKLNRIVHPLVGLGLAEFINAHRDEPLVVLEIPLLLEMGRRAPVDRVVVVTATPEQRIDRLLERGFNQQEVEARLKAQMPQEEKVKLADHVIANDGELEETRRQVHELAREYGVEVAQEARAAGAKRQGD